MNEAVRLVARREITSRLQQRGFRIGFAIALLIVVVACVVPSLFSDDDSTPRYDVAVVGDHPGLAAALARSETPRFTVHTATAAEAHDRVDDGDWDAAVLPGGRLVVDETDGDVVTAVQQVNVSTALVTRLGAAGLSSDDIREALTVRPLRVESTGSGDDGQRRAIAVITVIVLFTQLTTFCTWVAMGVVEEKASRVVELILSSIRPLQLLVGKLLGIGTLAAAQVLALGAVGLVVSTLAGTISIPASAFVTVLTGFVGFVLGFAFFAALAAALASTVSRQEEVSGVLAPVTLSLTVCYFASFATAGDPDSTLARVVSIVPPFSCVAMPGRIAGGTVPVLDVLLAVVLLGGAAAAILAVAARIYRATVLHSGTRVPLSRAWRGEAVADLG
ncbi:ABC-2 type transport system permease protein [Jatrophihabitans endophyticus]|uniref:ABC-2 type transport system permease protein n=1 Tax=Jatrophihabitans endophyticus TaxID=1206085 RepID=A0A1M5RCU6_9ACTN|nr:ABC transporter permease [Jatrophihabitans endophyticus]SHH23960.1 ABC-2 type transport system permease protein [Jatrophihabitans endophyticus]